MDLLEAHRALDMAVEAAYDVNFNGDKEKIVAHLFKLYVETIEKRETLRFMSAFICMQRYVAHLQLSRTPIYLECGFCCLRLIFTLALVFYSFSGKPKVAGGRGVVFS